MRVLIVEDEIVIALEIEAIVRDRRPDAETIIVHSVREALDALDGGFGFALLDIDVTDGKTYPLALALRQKGVPFVFVSGADFAEAPADIMDVPRVPKPFAPNDLQCAIDACAAPRPPIEAEIKVDQSADQDGGLR